MKRVSTASASSTKRLILGVQRLSLGSSGTNNFAGLRQRTPSPICQASNSPSMEVVSGMMERASHGVTETLSRLSSGEEGMFVETRSRSGGSGRRHKMTRCESEKDIAFNNSRERMWAVPKINQLRTEARNIINDAMTTIFKRRSGRTRHTRASSDPGIGVPRKSRLAKDLLEEDVGYTADCECDLDEDGVCLMCGRVSSSRCSF